jgi:hypothetical protein
MGPGRARAPGRARFNSSDLVRQLADLAVDDAVLEPPSLAQGLGRWLGWTDAIALASALQGPVATAAQPLAIGAAAAQCQLVRSELTAAISRDPAVTGDSSGLLLLTPRPGAPLESPTDYAPYRRHALALQRQMEAAITPLRARLRAAVAAVPALARLAALDAVLDNALAARQRSLLAAVPSLLQRRFDQLARNPAGGPPAAWLATFGHELKAVLLAELDTRLQPAEGLLDALRNETSPA